MIQEEVYWSVKLSIQTNDQYYVCVFQYSDQVYQDKQYSKDQLYFFGISQFYEDEV